MLCIGCNEEKPIKAKGLCNKCYIRVQRHNDVTWGRKKKGDSLCSYCHEKPVHAKDFCVNCYARYLKNGSPERVKVRTDRICNFCGKIMPMKAKGLCFACYKRARDHGGDPAYIVKNVPAKIRECSFCGKVKEIVGNNLCNACYQRKWKRGTAEYAPKRIKLNCKVKGCKKEVVAYGFCDIHRARTIDRRKAAHKTLVKRFRITVDEYERMYNNQNGVCAICGQPEIRKQNGNTINLPVDHCHATGKIRGLLCSKCNTSLGGFKDSTDLLTKAINYLKQHE